MWKLARRKRRERSGSSSFPYLFLSSTQYTYFMSCIPCVEKENFIYSHAAIPLILIFPFGICCSFSFVFTYPWMFFVDEIIKLWLNFRVLLRLYIFAALDGYEKPEKDDNIIKFGVLKHIMLHIIIALLLCSLAPEYLRRRKELLYHKSILSTFVFNRFCDIKMCSFGARRTFRESSPPLSCMMTAKTKRIRRNSTYS